MATVSAALNERPAEASAAPSRWRPWLRGAVGAGILLAILIQAGAEPFLRGFASVSPAAIAAATALTAVATAAAAWRWRILAGRLGLRLGWRESVSAYYRSQFLNTVLPGGVVGDVHRAVSHGRSVDQVGQAARAVAAERAVGQVVQLALAVVVLASIGFSAYAPAVGLVAVVGILIGATVVVAVLNRRARAALLNELAILRGAFGSVDMIVRVVVASAVVVTAHIATFLVACAAVGVDATGGRVFPAAVIAILASAIPLSIGGWGPREGAAAWAFAVAGLGATTGITVATTYGVLAMVALVPGAVVLAASVLRRRRGVPATERGWIT